jgi:hypothetical protein
VKDKHIHVNYSTLKVTIQSLGFEWGIEVDNINIGLAEKVCIHLTTYQCYNPYFSLYESIELFTRSTTALNRPRAMRIPKFPLSVWYGYALRMLTSYYTKLNPLATADVIPKEMFLGHVVAYTATPSSSSVAFFSLVTSRAYVGASV